MLAIHTILYPIDFSEYSEPALHLACALARDYTARLVVLHAAVPPTTYYGEGALPLDSESEFRQARQQLGRLVIPDVGVRAERMFEEGSPGPTILRVARELPASVIVMGTHGRTGLARFLMGSVAEQVVRKANCPVLTVKSPIAETAAPVETATSAIPNLRPAMA